MRRSGRLMKCITLMSLSGRGQMLMKVVERLLLLLVPLGRLKQ
jgi:hypothetical protein